MDDFDRQWWLQVDILEESLPIESEFMRIRDLATLGGNTANASTIGFSDKRLPIPITSKSLFPEVKAY